VEILSPDERIGETIAKLERYHDWGVPYCWLIDPKHRRAWNYPKGGELLEASTQLEAGEIKLDVVEVFSVLDRV
jgi:Uma2 family endonuclease